MILIDIIKSLINNLEECFTCIVYEGVLHLLYPLEKAPPPPGRRPRVAGLAVSPLHDVRHSLHQAARPEVFLGEVPLLGLDKQEVLSGVVKVGDV